MCGYFGGEPIGRAEVEGKFKNGKATGKDGITGEMIKCRGDSLAEAM